MKKLLFVLPILVAFVMMVTPVVSADDAVELAIQAALGTDPAAVNTVAGIVRAILDELRSAVANELHDPLFATTGQTVSGLARTILDEQRDINVQIGIDPASGSAKDGGHTIGSLLRLSVTEQRDLQADVDSLQTDVQQLQASVDEVIDLLKTPQGRRAGWNQ